jgi:peptidoglycan/xylan/chitin deacetylase (PgdA/CDA1 family)
LLGWIDIKKRIKAVAGEVLARVGLHRRLLDGAGIVVTFHRVDNRYRDGVTRSTDDFELFGRFFQAHFDVIPLGEFVERMVEKKPLQGKLSITFDDGYRDNYTNAAPILQRLGLPATFFVVSDFIESDTVAWWDRETQPVPAWMSWEEVRALRSEGFEIGAHTRTHVDLADVRGDAAADEIAGPRNGAVALAEG